MTLCPSQVRIAHHGRPPMSRPLFARHGEARPSTRANRPLDSSRAKESRTRALAARRMLDRNLLARKSRGLDESVACLGRPQLPPCNALRVDDRTGAIPLWIARRTEHRRPRFRREAMPWGGV